MNRKLGINPWLSMWVRPRKTIRTIIDYQVNYRFLLLCSLFGLFGLVLTAQKYSLGHRYSPLTIIIASLLLAFPYGYIHFNLLSLGFFWLGKLIKGKGTFKQVRAALVWSSVPSLVAVLIAIIVRIGITKSLFSVDPNALSKLSAVRVDHPLSNTIVSILFIWGFVIFLQSLGEVQQFSVWLSLLNIFLTGLVIGMIFRAVTAINISLKVREGDHVQFHETGSKELVMLSREFVFS